MRERLDQAVREIRWAVRALIRRPAFAATAVLTLALGIAAMSAVLTLFNAQRMSRLPYERPERLALLWETEAASGETSTVSPGNYWAWRERARSFSDLAAFNVDLTTLSGSGPAERMTASVVTPNFFAVLGVGPALGSLFDRRSAREADYDLVVLSHALWTRRFGQDPNLVGADIRLDGRPHRVVGVMPPEFRQPERSLTWQRPQLWRPMDIESGRADFRSRYLRTVGRLEAGVTLESARIEMAQQVRRLAEEQPEFNGTHGFSVRSLDDYLLRDGFSTLLMLSAAGVALLLIVCANVANLTLARTHERARELAVRAALGSGSRRLFRQLLVESAVVAVVAAGLGALLVYGGRGALQYVQARFFSELVDVAVDIRTFLIMGGLALATALLLGIPVASAASRVDLGAVLSEGGKRAGVGPGARRLRSLLIVGQVALATALLSVAVLLSRSFLATVNVPPGFEARNRVTFAMTVPASRYPERDDVEQFYRNALREVGAVPGVVALTMASDLPFTSENRWTTVGFVGRPYDERTAPRVDFHTVLPDYFGVMGIPMVHGTTFEPRWEPVEGDVPVVVNRHLATMMTPDGNAVGRALELHGSEGTTTLTVVGVVDNVLDDGFTASSEPIFYRPFGSNPQRRMAVVAEVRGESAGVLSDLRTALARVDPDVPAAGLRTVESLLAETVARPRAASLIGAAFAVLALLVAAAGIYGVLSYLIQARTRELGIRAALGATARQLVRMVLGQSGKLLLIGLVFGWTAALVAGRGLSGLLFGVPSWDPVSLVGASVLLGAVGTLAAWLPARRAARADPMLALRQE